MDWLEKYAKSYREGSASTITLSDGKAAVVFGHSDSIAVVTSTDEKFYGLFTGKVDAEEFMKAVKVKQTKAGKALGDKFKDALNSAFSSVVAFVMSAMEKMAEKGTPLDVAPVNEAIAALSISKDQKLALKKIDWKSPGRRLEMKSVASLSDLQIEMLDSVARTVFEDDGPAVTQVTEFKNRLLSVAKEKNFAVASFTSDTEAKGYVNYMLVNSGDHKHRIIGQLFVRDNEWKDSWNHFYGDDDTSDGHPIFASGYAPLFGGDSNATLPQSDHSMSINVLVYLDKVLPQVKRKLKDMASNLSEVFGNWFTRDKKTQSQSWADRLADSLKEYGWGLDTSDKFTAKFKIGEHATPGQLTAGQRLTVYRAVAKTDDDSSTTYSARTYIGESGAEFELGKGVVKGDCVVVASQDKLAYQDMISVVASYFKGAVVGEFSRFTDAVRAEVKNLGGNVSEMRSYMKIKAETKRELKIEAKINGKNVSNKTNGSTEPKDFAQSLMQKINECAPFDYLALSMRLSGQIL